MDREPHPERTVILQVAQIVSATEAEGPGVRFALWFQGCPLRCPGCCNPEMLPFEGGTKRTAADVLAESAALGARGGGATPSRGGEPLAHATGAVVLARALKERGMTVMVFSG